MMSGPGVKMSRSEVRLKTRSWSRLIMVPPGDDSWSIIDGRIRGKACPVEKGIPAGRVQAGIPLLGEKAPYLAKVHLG